MRPNQSNKRSRGRGSNNNNNNRKNSNPLTRNYESNGPDVRIRGNAQTVADKYAQLYRDAHSSGDSVAAENYLQHAEHYYRIISAAQAQQQSRAEVAQQDQRRDAPEGNAEANDASQAAPASPTPAQGEDQPAQSAVQAEGSENTPKPEPKPRRERRPRRAPRKEAATETPVVEAGADAAQTPAPVDEKAKSADPAKAPQPSINELPSFVTGDAATAAE